jgi:outer membrane autotransporter protein
MQIKKRNTRHKFKLNAIALGTLACCSLFLLPTRTVAQSVTQTGDVSPTLSGTNPQVNNLNIGQNGTGTVNVIGGATITSTSSLNIGRTAGSDGTLTVQDRGSKVTVNNDFNVGNSGNGKLNLTNGATVQSTQFYVGRLAGSNGSVLVSGNGSAIQTSSFIYVGNNGGADFTITNGGAISADGVIDIGRNHLGTLSISGDGSSLQTTRSLNVGRSTGHGILNVGAGAARIVSQQAYIGREPTATGEIFFTGNDALWTNAEAFNLGYEGSGTLTMSAGTILTDTMVLAQLPGSSATLNLTGNASSRGMIQTNSLTGGQGAINITLDGGGLSFLSGGNVISGIASMNIGPNGAVIDTQANDIDIDTIFNKTSVTTHNVGIIKQGTGILTYRGEFNTPGTNYVQQGHLIAETPTPLTTLTPRAVFGTGDMIVGGAGAPAIFSIPRNLQLPNHVIVNDQGRFTGYGHIAAATINAGGVISPGGRMSEFDTLTIDGDLVMHPGSTYEIDFGASADLLIVKGTADLSGLLLDVDIHETFDETKRYEVLIAEGGVAGTFDEAKSEYFAYLNIIPRYNIANLVYLDVMRNDHDFREFALTPNQVATADALQGINTASEAIYRYVLGLPRHEVPRFFDSLSGEIHATLQHALYGETQFIAESSLQALRNGLSTTMPNCSDTSTASLQTADAIPCRGPGWAKVIANWRHQNGDGNAASAKTSNYGLMFGFDEEVAQSGWRVGGAFGYTRATMNVDDRHSKSEIDNYSLSFYGGKAFEHKNNKLNVLAGLAYTQHAITTERTVPRLSQQLTASYVGRTYQMFGEFAYAMPINTALTVEPFLGWSVAGMDVGGFRENGGFAGLNAGSAGTQTHINHTLGVRMSSDLIVGNYPATLNASLGWKHVWGSHDVRRTMAFNANSPEFIIASMPITANTGLIGLSGQMQMRPNTWVGLMYSGEFGSGFRDQSAMVTLRMAF